MIIRNPLDGNRRVKMAYKLVLILIGLTTFTQAQGKLNFYLLIRIISNDRSAINQRKTIKETKKAKKNLDHALRYS